MAHTKSTWLDLEYYYGKDRLEEVTDPSSMTLAVQKYVKALEDACAIHPALLVAHSYSRYLGDLSGNSTCLWCISTKLIALS